MCIVSTVPLVKNVILDISFWLEVAWLRFRLDMLTLMVWRNLAREIAPHVPSLKLTAQDVKPSISKVMSANQTVPQANSP